MNRHLAKEKSSVYEKVNDFVSDFHKNKSDKKKYDNYVNKMNHIKNNNDKYLSLIHI